MEYEGKVGFQGLNDLETEWSNFAPSYTQMPEPKQKKNRVFFFLHQKT